MIRLRAHGLSRVSPTLLSLVLFACHSGSEPPPSTQTAAMQERDIHKANEELTRRVIDLPGVAGVGIGECEGEPCLRVMVDHRTEELLRQIPDSVAGFRVEVEETGPMEALDPEPPHR